MLKNKNSNSECTLICIHTALCRSYGVIMMQPHAYINQNQHGRMTMPSTLAKKYWFMLQFHSFKNLDLVKVSDVLWSIFIFNFLFQLIDARKQIVEIASISWQFQNSARLNIFMSIVKSDKLNNFLPIE